MVFGGFEWVKGEVGGWWIGLAPLDHPILVFGRFFKGLGGI